MHLDRGYTQPRKYEEYAYVLDFVERGKSSTVRGRQGIIVTGLGEDIFKRRYILYTKEDSYSGKKYAVLNYSVTSADTAGGGIFNDERILKVAAEVRNKVLALNNVVVDTPIVQKTTENVVEDVTDYDTPIELD